MHNANCRRVSATLLALMLAIVGCGGGPTEPARGTGGSADAGDTKGTGGATSTGGTTGSGGVVTALSITA